MRVVVTGGSRGIGRAVAVRASAPGNHVLVNYGHDAGAAELAVAECRRLGATAEAVLADAGTSTGLRELATQAQQSMGGVDLLVHCAVTPITGNTLTIEEAEFTRSIQRNGASWLWAGQAFSETLAEGASLIFLSSQGGARAVPGYVALGAAKALGESLVRYLAVALGPRSIRVNAISAGAVDTAALRSVFGDTDRMLQAAARRNPMGRALTVDDIADAVLLLASPAGAMINGQVVTVDGGLGLLP